MKFNLWTQNGALNSKPIFDAFRQGCHTLGIETVDNSEADVDVIWSVLFNGRMAANKAIWGRNTASSKPTIVLEVGGINRGTTWKVGLNGINRDAYFGPVNNTDDRRRMLGLSLKPWRTEGEAVLICGQHDKSLQWQGMPRMSEWVMQTIESVQRHSTRPIIFRAHPRCRLEAIERQYKNVYRQEPNKINGSYDDYDIQFDNMHAVVSYSSNPGIHSIINGVPAFVGPASLAYDVGNDIDFMHDIEAPLTPDRTQWLNDYAHTEYTVEEISQGLPIKQLTSKLI